MGSVSARVGMCVSIGHHLVDSGQLISRLRKDHPPPQALAGLPLEHSEVLKTRMLLTPQ